MTHSRGRALGSVGAVAVSLACLLATGCRPEIEWGSRAVLLNETTLLRSFTEIEGFGKMGETHLAPEGTVFLQLEFLDIYDGTEYTRLPRSPVPIIVAPGGEEYRPRSMVMVWLAASTPIRGQPVKDRAHRLVYGPLPENEEGWIFRVGEQEVVIPVTDIEAPPEASDAPNEDTEALPEASEVPSEGIEAFNRGDYAAALGLFQPLAENGDAYAQVALGKMHVLGLGVPEDSREAVRWYRKAAEQDFAPGQTALAFSYLTGSGVAEDAGEAAKWFQRAAVQGFADAQVHLARQHEDGNGVSQDYAETVTWNRLAAEQGHILGLANLAGVYYRGQGVPRDYPEAVKWYRAASEKGDAHSRFQLATLYWQGRGVAKDYGEAVSWWQKAAEQGHGASQLNLGAAYGAGQGVTVNDVQAYKWFTLAASAGTEAADQNRARVAEDMTEIQIEEATRLAAEWSAAFETRKSTDCGITLNATLTSMLPVFCNY